MKKSVRKWSFRRLLPLLALVLLSGLLLSLPLLVPDPATTAAADKNPWLLFIGSFHPLFLHLPIGFLLLIVSLEALSFFHRDYQFPMRVPLRLNALAALVAAGLGFVLYLTGSWDSGAISDHLWQGLIFAVASLWLPWVYEKFKSKTTMVYSMYLIGTVALMVSAAHHGGEITHGDPLENAPWKLEPRVQKSADEILAYEDVIVPILESKCYSCHSIKKHKGGLRLDTIDFMLEGGDEDVALVPGEPLKSPLLTSIKIPLEEDEHMPPKKKRQITEAEYKILEWWIRAGAPANKRLTEIEIPDDVLRLILYLQK